MMAIQKMTRQHRDMLLNFLSQDPVANTFLIADIEQYGFYTPFQQVWLQWEQDKPAVVYLRFYQNLLIYGKGCLPDETFVNKIIQNYDIMVIMGRRSDMAGILEWGVNSGWQAQHKKLLSLGKNQTLAAPMHGMKIAGPEDADRIYAFLQQIEGFGAMYASKEMLVHRLESKDGLHLILETDGHILAHANSTVATRHTVMLGGVATRADVRGKGFSSAIVSELCRLVQARRLQPCVYSNAQPGHDLFMRLGFVLQDYWDTLERQH